MFYRKSTGVFLTMRTPIITKGNIEQVIERDKDLPQYDVYCPLLSLPFVFINLASK
jgi:hypothetical protein